MTDLLIRVFLAVHGAYGSFIERAHSEQGVSTVQYALLVALIAFLVAVVLAVLGPGIKGLFGSAHNCVSCKVGSLLRSSTEAQGS